MKTTQTCKVAVIGAGYTAREHIRAFAAVPGASLAGIFSRTRSRAEALASEFGIKTVCDSTAELYEKTHADLVVVTVTETSMNPVSRAAFEFPWTALLEKPAGYNVPDAEEIYAAAVEKDRKVLVALNRRFYCSTRSVMDDLHQLDGPRFIRVLDQEDQARALAGGQPKVVVENWMYANSIHMIDFFRLFGRGNIKQVTPVIPWDPASPGMVVSSIEFESGDQGLYEGIWNGPGPWAVNVATPAKLWEMRPVEQASFQPRGERKMQPIEIHAWDQTFKPGFRLQAEMAVAAALGQPSEAATLADALDTMRLIQAIFAPQIYHG